MANNLSSHDEFADPQAGGVSTEMIESTRIHAVRKRLERAITELLLLQAQGSLQPLRRGRYLLNTDSGVRGGQAALGWVLSDSQDRLIATHAEKIDPKLIEGAMIPGAEYCALISGLKFAHAHGVGKVRAYVDNQAVVDQINCVTRVRNATLRHLWREAKDLLDERLEDTRVYWIPRERNQVADALVRSQLS